MKKIILTVFMFLCLLNVYAITSNDILAKVKKSEVNFVSFEASLNPVGNKSKISKLGSQMDILTEVKNGSIKYKEGNKIKIEGKIQGIYVNAVENGYLIKYNLGPFKATKNFKDDPGRRYNSLDIGMLSSWLWENNTVTVLDESNGTIKLKFDPIQGGNESRYDLVWVDADTLKLIKREKYNTDGIFKLAIEYVEWKEILPDYYVTTKFKTYNNKREYLGTNAYTNLKINQPMKDGLFNVK